MTTDKSFDPDHSIHLSDVLQTKQQASVRK